MKCMEETLDACLQALRLPPTHHKRLRTSNLLERTFREHKRRTKVIPHFFTEEAAMKLSFAVNQQLKPELREPCEDLTGKLRLDRATWLT